MSATDLLHDGFLLALIAMTAATLLTRWVGFLLMGYVTLTPRVRSMLEALPGSVIIAAILPLVLRGPAAMLAVGAALATMIVARNDFAAVLAGMAVAALARFAGLTG